uniref:WAS/WASL-interacting protein family member 3 n=1 Tax=Phascolarctos cinereus TaxID=38626 RepID=A0A6P5JN56_PHACI|nr:WAS/WASL-interacting protein family member 3 [Phascolarctos cinereus]
MRRMPGPGEEAGGRGEVAWEVGKRDRDAGEEGRGRRGGCPPAPRQPPPCHPRPEPGSASGGRREGRPLGREAMTVLRSVAAPRLEPSHPAPPPPALPPLVSFLHGHDLYRTPFPPGHARKTLDTSVPLV